MTKVMGRLKQFRETPLEACVEGDGTPLDAGIGRCSRARMIRLMANNGGMESSVTWLGATDNGNRIEI